jgi:nitrogen fixation protein FixH
MAQLLHTPNRKPRSGFTGWHMTAILVAFFGVVIAVNVGMAVLATQGFSGEVVHNSYDASQRYNAWLGEAAKERALGWKAQVERRADGFIVVHLLGNAAHPLPAGLRLEAEAWHPLGLDVDRTLPFAQQADASFVSGQPLKAGRWRLRLRAYAPGRGEAPIWRAQELL